MAELSSPVAFALRAIYGEMAEAIISGARALPAKALMLGFGFRHGHVQEALEATLAGRTQRA